MRYYRKNNKFIDGNINFKNKIHQESKIILKDMSVTIETDKPISCC